MVFLNTNVTQKRIYKSRYKRHLLKQRIILYFYVMKCFLSFVLFTISSHGFSQLEFQKLADSAYMYTTYNTYKGNKISANGIIRLTNAGAIMIDSPWDTTQFQPLLDSIKTKWNQDVVFVIATHWHEDRSGGLEFYAKQGISTYSTRATKNLCRENNKPQAEYTFTADTTFLIGGVTFETYFPGAGHTPDNIIVYFPSERLMAGGCFIKSVEATDLGNLSDANLGMWPIAAKNLKKKYRKVKIVVPGHDKVDGKKALRHTIRLLR